jgi:OOP family OmpA-OmpF porin
LEGTSFASGSAKLNASADAQLNQVVEFAAKYKDAALKITGYTDDRGDVNKNIKLSAARAESVKAYLVKHGVAADRLSTKGEGSANPVASNKTAEGRAQNRRVEIGSVVKEEKKVLVQ